MLYPPHTGTVLLRSQEETDLKVATGHPPMWGPFEFHIKIWLCLLLRRWGCGTVTYISHSVPRWMWELQAPNPRNHHLNSTQTSRAHHPGTWTFGLKSEAFLHAPNCKLPTRRSSGSWKQISSGAAMRRRNSWLWRLKGRHTSPPFHSISSRTL